jgi:hypothetical protein
MKPSEEKNGKIAIIIAIVVLVIVVIAIVAKKSDHPAPVHKTTYTVIPNTERHVS